MNKLSNKDGSDGAVSHDAATLLLIVLITERREMKLETLCLKVSRGNRK